MYKYTMCNNCFLISKFWCTDCNNYEVVKHRHWLEFVNIKPIRSMFFVISTTSNGWDVINWGILHVQKGVRYPVCWIFSVNIPQKTGENRKKQDCLSGKFLNFWTILDLATPIFNSHPELSGRSKWQSVFYL